MNLQGLIADWRLRAALAQRTGAPTLADALEVCADELEAELHAEAPGGYTEGVRGLAAYDQDMR